MFFTCSMCHRGQFGHIDLLELALVRRKTTQTAHGDNRTNSNNNNNQRRPCHSPQGASRRHPREKQIRPPPPPPPGFKRCCVARKNRRFSTVARVSTVVGFVMVLWNGYVGTDVHRSNDALTMVVDASSASVCL